ncbi:MAG: tolB protein precursor protein [Myxococcota bacterium]
MLKRALPVTLFLATFFLPLAVDAQIFVYPRRPSKTNVQYYDFTWREIDLLVGPRASGKETWQPGPRYHNEHTWRMRQAGGSSGPTKVTSDTEKERPSEQAAAPEGDEELEDWSGGVRLYFYEEEREVAQWAASYTKTAYRDLVEVFDYVPRETVPFFLYSSYQEFLQTNLFPIQEGVLGVTSPRNLKMTQPYFGDHRQFRDVFKHELAHQFMIQKVRTVAKESGALGNPLESFPLWFIEGSAEYYNKGGIDPETDALIRDIVLHPDPRRGYMLPDFYSDRPRSYITTYKYGQIRCAFLEDVYGEGTVRRIMEKSPLLTGTQSNPKSLNQFSKLIQKLTGDSKDRVSDRFQAWLKDRVYGVYLEASQRPSDYERIKDTAGFVMSMRASDDGSVLLYRNIDRNAGRVELNFVHYLAPSDQKRIVADRQPGVESLHPLAGRNFDISRNAIAFSAQSGPRDVVYIQQFESEVEQREIPDVDEGQAIVGTTKKWRSDIKLEARWEYDLAKHDIVTVDSIAYEPNGERLAMIAQRASGHRDLFLLTPKTKKSYGFEALTDDIYAEREVDWGRDGIVYNSDATSHGYYNLFLIDPDEGSRTRLTFEERDQDTPSFVGNGERLFYTAYDEYGGNLYERVETETGYELVSRTQGTTILTDAAPGPESDIWALYYYQGRRTPTRVPALTPIGREAGAAEDDADAYEVPSLSLDGSTDYKSFSPENWELGQLFGIFGVSTQGFAGQLFGTAHDRLRNHSLYLSAYAAGDFKTTDGRLFYINQANRLIWGTGLFQEIGYRRNTTFSEQLTELDAFLQLERFYGASGTVRWPFDKYRHVQGELAVGGVDYFLFDGTREYLQDGARNGSQENLYDDWQTNNEGQFFQTEASLGFGLNTLRYHPATGPVAGSSALLLGRAAVQPFDDALFGSVRLDAEHYFQLYRRFHLLVRGAAGRSLGGKRSRQFFLSSFDTLRSVQYGNPDFLIGTNFAFTTAEFQFPINWLVSVPFLDLEGILGADFGGVGNSVGDAWDRRVFNLATGVNIGFAWLAFRLHFAKPFDIGAVEVPNNGKWQTNFSIGYRYR